MTYRAMKGIGATALGAKPTFKHCLFWEDGSPIYDKQPRDPEIYGNKDDPYRVCFRNWGPGVPSKMSSKHLKNCLGIKDIYDKIVCYDALPPGVAPPKNVPAKPKVQTIYTTKVKSIYSPTVKTSTPPIVVQPPITSQIPALPNPETPSSIPVVLHPETPSSIPSSETPSSIPVATPADEYSKFREVSANQGEGKKALVVGGLLVLAAVGGVVVWKARKK